MIFITPLLAYASYKDWLRHYCLQAEKSVVELSLLAQDRLIIRFGSGLKVKVLLVDKLLINKSLMLRFEMIDKRIEDAVSLSQPSPLAMYGFNFLHSLRVFFFQPYEQVYLSEATLGTEKFRQLLRRLNNFD